MPATDPDLPQTFERRAYVRYRRRLESLWGLLGMTSRHQVEGQIYDLSTTGVGLMLAQAFPLDTLLVIRLPTATKGWNSHLVRVKRCNAVSEGMFQVGCAFAKPLSVGQLREHLS